MNYWLVKSEPGTWSWEDQVAAGTTAWDGVRNAQAQMNMRQMERGDRVFFYHSGKERAIVGLCKVAREGYPDPADEQGKLVLVDLEAVEPVTPPVPLSKIKADDTFAQLALVRQPRLSVMPVEPAAWKKLARLAGVKA